MQRQICWPKYPTQINILIYYMEEDDQNQGGEEKDKIY